MATTQASATGPALRPYRISVKQFEKMIEAGVFPDGAHVELLGGLLAQMTKHQPHNVVVGQLANLIRSMLPDGWIVSEEKSVQLGRFWRPEPDIAVVRGRWADYFQQAPRGPDIALLVEVADSSYTKDSRIKLRTYAAARIPAYWIVHVERRQVEVHTAPTGRGRQAHYEQVATYPLNGQARVVLDGQDLGAIAVAELFV